MTQIFNFNKFIQCIGHKYVALVVIVVFSNYLNVNKIVKFFIAMLPAARRVSIFFISIIRFNT